ncbi:prolipoprotein diacylglyceryl transferase [Thermodesulfobacteriota bacterium]
MHPVLIEIGPLVIRWYGVMIAVACMVGLWVAGIEAERKGISKEKIQSFFIYAIIGGIVGARLYYVVFSDFTQFKTAPFSIFAIWQGGLAIHGGILGGLVVSVIYTRIQKISFWKLADTLAPSLILGQAIGRIGCLLNGDAHGYPTDQPWVLA